MSCPPESSPVAYNDHRMDAANIQLFIQDHSVRIPEYFQDAFSIAVIVSGWKLAEMYPYCLKTLPS